MFRVWWQMPAGGCDWLGCLSLINYCEWLTEGLLSLHYKTPQVTLILILKYCCDYLL